MLRTDSVKPLDLLAELRARTAEAHTRLEHDLDLLREPLQMQHFIHLLERFHGFHAVWEPRVARMLSKEAAFLTPRRRTHRVAQDLMALGHSNEEIAELLGVRPNTIKFHISEIFRRLGVRNRIEAIAQLETCETPPR